MRISIDVDDLGVRTWGGQAITLLTGKRRDRVSVEARFTRAGIVQELHPSATGILGVKKLKAFTGGYMAAALSWVKSGSGTGTIYTFDLNLNTVELAAEFAQDPDKVALALEVEWLIGNYRSSSLAVPMDVTNDYIRGDETAPADAAP